MLILENSIASNTAGINIIISVVCFFVLQRTIQGKLSYTPMLVRLDCGKTAAAPRGFWEAGGFGLVGIYKSDWDKFGGFNIHKEGWGGEDWDIIYRIVENSMEVERLRTPHVLHIDHNKIGMWKT